MNHIEQQKGEIEMEDITSVRVSKETRNQLKALSPTGASLEDTITGMIELTVNILIEELNNEITAELERIKKARRLKDPERINQQRLKIEKRKLSELEMKDPLLIKMIKRENRKALLDKIFEKEIDPDVKEIKESLIREIKGGEIDD
jgi:hypothetical protein